MNKTTELAAHVRGELGKVIVGQRESLDQLLLVMLVGGHALVEGVPGLAKTLAVKALAQIFQLKFQRVQCTPDLMPADILGANVFNLSTSAFRAASRPDLHRSAARRRNQPHAAANAIGASGSHGREASDHRRHAL